jgi:hypothetical protein
MQLSFFLCINTTESFSEKEQLGIEDSGAGT